MSAFILYLPDHEIESFGDGSMIFQKMTIIFVFDQLGDIAPINAGDAFVFAP